MVGVGEIPLTRELSGGRKLVLMMGWESDGNLIDGVGTIHGTLPGRGCTSYTIGVMKEDDLDTVDENHLQEFHFRGGGELATNQVPPLVRRAFEEWFEKLMAGAPAESKVTGLAKTPEAAPKHVNELQWVVAEYCKKTGRNLSLPYRAIDLCAETGELAQEILRDSDYGKRRILKVSDKTVAELGDTLFSLLCMANEMEVDVQELLHSTLATYDRRQRNLGS
jgi:NTP pyrophosphatase (non-canonical NTP hydrolase)